MNQEDVVEGLKLLYSWEPTAQSKLSISQVPEEILFGEPKEKNINQYSPHSS